MKTRLERNRSFGIDANVLRLLAIVFMLLDHMWATIVPGNQWMTWVGRMAFPIFAFQAAEGYIHTYDFRRYALRLLGFALLSEIPFNLFYAGSIVFPFHQNVMFTLLLGLLAIRQADTLRREEGIKRKLIHSLLLLLIGLGGIVTFPDYGLMGVATVLCFWLFRGFPLGWLFQLGAMVILNIVTYSGQVIPISFAGLSLEFPTQGFAVFSLPFIWLYNGKKGAGGKTLRIFWYLFYPLHMLVLYFLWQSL